MHVTLAIDANSEMKYHMQAKKGNQSSNHGHNIKKVTESQFIIRLFSYNLSRPAKFHPARKTHWNVLKSVYYSAFVN